MAKDLLLNSASSISEIAHSCGYKNLEHFTRQFKKSCGISPLKYRRQYFEVANEPPLHVHQSNETI